jgi:hypothetical protein
MEMIIFNSCSPLGSPVSWQGGVIQELSLSKLRPAGFNFRVGARTI